MCAEDATRAGSRTTPRYFRIFINYRREEASFAAHQLYEVLAERFGEDNVFIDVDTIEPGLPFAEVIDREVASCDVFVAVIGKDWISLADANGQRRIDKPDDWVRLEIEGALSRNIRVIPALLRGAAPLNPEELPETLRPLAGLHAVPLSDDHRWRDDVGRLIQVLEKLKAGGTDGRVRATGFRRFAFLLDPAANRSRRLALLIGALAGVLAAAVAVPLFALGGNGSGDNSPASGAGAPVRLGFGDYVLIKGASVNCLVSPTAVPAGAIECYRTNAAGILPRSYSGLVSENGASIFYYDRKLHYHHVYGQSNPARLPVAVVKAPTNARSIKTHGSELGASDTVRVLDTHIRCRTSAASRQVSVTCFYARANGTPAPGSYAVSVTKTAVVLDVVAPDGRLDPVRTQRGGAHGKVEGA